MPLWLFQLETGLQVVGLLVTRIPSNAKPLAAINFFETPKFGAKLIEQALAAECRQIQNPMGRPQALLLRV
jgi:hypothetical protein